MKNAALLFGVVIIIGGVGWYWLGTADVAEAPVNSIEPGTSLPADDLIDSPSLPTQPNSSEPVVSSPVPSVVGSFDDCVSAGNPVMESYPRQCRHGDLHFVEEVSPIDSSAAAGTIMCTPESKLAEICTMEYAPVCGLVQVQCVTTPCHPVPETFSNACVACGQGNVISYTEGECSLQAI